jgi:hypothetical protein
LDTNAVSDLIRQDARVLARLAAVSATDELRTCVIVRGEIPFGIDRLARGKHQNELRARASSIFAHLACGPLGHRLTQIIPGSNVPWKKAGPCWEKTTCGSPLVLWILEPFW